MNNVNSLHKNIEIKRNVLEKIKTSMAKLEDSLHDVIKASNVFNDRLSKFLGRDELSLVYDDNSKGYKVLRKENGEKAKGLSEGEKTAISFIYFITKIYEKNNDITKSIIIIDDPITSLDSNSIFNVYAIIISLLFNAKQLFVLTHNFQLLSILKRRCGNKNMYVINNYQEVIDGSEKRLAKLEDMPKSLKDSTSEYTFIFGKIKEFCDSQRMCNLDEVMSMINLARKMLETFTSFKFPNISSYEQRLKSIFEIVYGIKFDSIEETAKIMYETIYKFTNYFSHENNVDFISDRLDIQIAQAKPILREILKLIKEVDECHYKSCVGIN